MFGWKMSDVTLTDDTKAKLKEIGGLHEDCIEKYTLEYNENKKLYNHWDAYYLQVVARGEMGYSSRASWLADCEFYLNRSNLYAYRTNQSFADLELCYENRKADILALLDALLDTCMSCSEIKKVLIEAYGDVTTEAFDLICIEHDEAKKTPTNCCLKVLCNPCNYRYEP